MEHRRPRLCALFWLCCLISFLTVFLAGCAGKPPKPPLNLPQPALEEAPTPSDKRLREAISYYMGADYKYGGTTKDGLDCSGFVMKTYERAGVKVPRTSELQFQSGKSVPQDELKYGDLLFFNKYCQSKYYYARLPASFPGCSPKMSNPAMWASTSATAASSIPRPARAASPSAT